jgi:hypothetical protein
MPAQEILQLQELPGEWRAARLGPAGSAANG